MIGITKLQETSSRIEPCLLESIGTEMVDLVADLSAAAARLGNRLHSKTAANLADLVRVMNCYYSNLIEGHNTTPREIERALDNEFEQVEERRNLQIEARAHIRVQKEIDVLHHARNTLPEPASVAFIRWLHQSFYQDAPEAMLWVKGTNRQFKMVPGEFRSKAIHDVSVGRHLPPTSARVQAFMAYFERRYQLASLGSGSRVIAMAAAHHRLNYIHPFADGNGRVSRLMSHAMALKAGIGAHGLWSVSRGLARGLENSGEYKQMMDYADTPRQGDLDGRGNLSLRALTEFVSWFLKVCLDQVNFMDNLFALNTLTDRLKTYVAQRNLKPEAYRILEEVLRYGEMPRGEAERVSGLKERTARYLLANLIEDGILTSDTPKGPLHLCFPLHTVETLFPKLFPEA